MGAIAENIISYADDSCLKSYKKGFLYDGDELFEKIYQQNKYDIKIKKSHVAIANLKLIFNATFKLSSQTCFHNMSVRDLAQETGISMGSIYSCINKKENIIVIVKNLISEISRQYIALGQQQSDDWSKLESTLRMHFYNSCLLQQWLFFLYFETRSLPAQHQADSKQIELNAIINYKSIIDDGVNQGFFKSTQSQYVAQSIVISIQDWYLKPWKYKSQKIDAETYLKELLEMTKTSLSVS